MKVLLAGCDVEQAGEWLADAVASLSSGVVGVDMARPNRNALDGIRRLAAATPRPALLFVDEDGPGFMEAAIGAGVSSCNAPGMPPPDVKPILRAAVPLFRRPRQARDALKEAEPPLNEGSMSEPDAHKFLRRTAMSTARRIVDVASDTINDREGNAG